MYYIILFCMLSILHCVNILFCADAGCWVTALRGPVCPLSSSAGKRAPPAGSPEVWSHVHTVISHIDQTSRGRQGTTEVMENQLKCHRTNSFSEVLGGGGGITLKMCILCQQIEVRGQTVVCNSSKVQFFVLCERIWGLFVRCEEWVNI